MVSDKARKVLRSIGFKLIAVSLILMGLCVILELSFRPVIETVSANECHLAVSEMINTAVSEELSREDISYTKLVELSTNPDGEIIAAQSNVVSINKLKTGITQRLEAELRAMESTDIGIPVGTLSGISLLHGRGFEVGMAIKPIGYPQTRIISEFTEAGINQTRHRIIIEITVDADAVIPGFSSEVSVSTSIIAAETIIVGRVPDAFTHVVSGDNDLVGILQDYGATLD